MAYAVIEISFKKYTFGIPEGMVVKKDDIVLCNVAGDVPFAVGKVLGFVPKITFDVEKLKYIEEVLNDRIKD